ncbi:formylglycine-generating enzyme family protein, partial [bacterium]|nr:formylglycine-generating enzyme family protein [bacterium]
MRFVFLCFLSSIYLCLCPLIAEERAHPPTFTDQFGIDFILVTSGKYATPVEKDAGLEEDSIEVDQPFYLSRTEITQDQWEKLMGSHTWQNSAEYQEHGGYGEGANFPVYFVSFTDAQSFIGRLNEKMNKPTYRLPTEMEWEYAARAGSSTPYSFGADPEALDRFGWFEGNADDTQEVGKKQPNAWGFFDMHGNVWEWVLDDNEDPYILNPKSDEPPERNKRGGSWRKAAVNCQVTSVGVQDDNTREDDIGFRLVRIIELPKSQIDTKTDK